MPVYAATPLRRYCYYYDNDAARPSSFGVSHLLSTFNRVSGRAALPGVKL